MLVTIVFTEKSKATKIHLNLVALKILQMLFVIPLISTKFKKKNLIMNSQMRESLTMSWGFHFEHCYWERDCDQFSFSWMGDCRRPPISRWRAQHFAVASHQRHNWGLLSLGRCCIYTNPSLPPSNSNGWGEGGCKFTDFGFLLISEKTRVEVLNAERHLTLSFSCGFLKAMQWSFIKWEVRGDVSALIPSLWTVKMESK